MLSAGLGEALVDTLAGVAASASQPAARRRNGLKTTRDPTLDWADCGQAPWDPLPQDAELRHEGSHTGQRGDEAEVEDSATRISPVKQEARRPKINDLVGGSPALRARRRHDHQPFAYAEKSQRSASQASGNLQEDLD